MLGTVILALHHDVGRQMRNTNGGFRAVDVLATSARGPKHIDPQIGGIDVYFNVIVYFRGHKHGREGGMPPVAGIEW